MSESKEKQVIRVVSAGNKHLPSAKDTQFIVGDKVIDGVMGFEIKNSGPDFVIATIEVVVRLG